MRIITYFQLAYEGLSSRRPRGIDNISSESIKNDPLEILEVLKSVTNHNGSKQPCTDVDMQP